MSLKDDYDALEAPAARTPRALRVNDLIKSHQTGEVYLLARVGCYEVQLVSPTRRDWYSLHALYVADPDRLTREEALHVCPGGELEYFDLVEPASP